MKSIHHPRSQRWLRHGLFLALSTFVIQHSSFAAESPLYIPFQGQVTNQAGVLTSDGQYSVIFNLYDQAVGGQPVWSERHVKIGVTRGMINVFLGSISTLTVVDFSQTKYLGITVDADNLATTADPEMVPRSLIMPAFHAKKAEKMMVFDAGSGASLGTSFGWAALFDNGNPTTGRIPGAKLADETVTSSKITNGTMTSDDFSTELKADSVIPSGSIMPFAGSVLPTGWLWCDGSAVSRITFQRLFAAIQTAHGPGNGTTTFNLPDYRGRFLRGVDPGLGRDPGGRTPMLAGGASSGLGTIQSQATARNALSLSGTTTFASAAHSHGSGTLRALIFRGGVDVIVSQGPYTGSYPVGSSHRNSGGWASDGGGYGGSPTARVEGDTGGPSEAASVGLGAGDIETRPVNAAVNYIIKL